MKNIFFFLVLLIFAGLFQACENKPKLAKKTKTPIAKISQENVIQRAGQGKPSGKKRPTPIIKRLANSIVFSVCEVDTAQELMRDILYKDALEMTINRRIEGYSFKDAYTKRMISNHSFVGTLQTAYASHYPVTISPDMIWLLICQGVSIHINQNAETMRSQFVNHQGKKIITIRNDFVKNGYNDWANSLPVFTDSIKKYIKDDIYDWMIPKFSTTTPNETIAYQVTLLESMQKYFDYGMNGCGIPFITLEGTPDDWKKIRSQVEKLRKYNLNLWIDNLTPILDQFVAASEGKVDVSFWENIITYHSMYGVIGREEKIENGINGWIIKLFPYLQMFVSTNTMQARKFIANPHLKGEDYLKVRLQPLDFPDGLSKFDFKWTDKNYIESDMEFKAGFVGAIQDKKTKALRPEIGWAVYDKNSPKVSQK